jgi:predicted dinucleotide-binding enzyme
VSGTTNENAARDADIIYFSPWGSLSDRNVLLKSIAPHITGKIVVDISVSYLPLGSQCFRTHVIGVFTIK